MRKRLNIRALTQAGVLTAMIALLTAYVKVPLPVGYAHMGDGVVMLAGMMLGPYGAIPAALGSSLGDVLAGFSAYALFTAIIKGVMGLVAGRFLRPDERASLRNVSVLILAFVWMVAGYLIFDTIMFDEKISLAQVGGNISQAVVGMALSIMFLNIRHRFVARK